MATFIWNSRILNKKTLSMLDCISHEKGPCYLPFACNSNYLWVDEKEPREIPYVFMNSTKFARKIAHICYEER